MAYTMNSKFLFAAAFKAMTISNRLPIVGHDRVFTVEQVSSFPPLLSRPLSN